ncbi:coatomer subunit delta-like [Humulus lupulus]|uniref:coatomer subunit delta-like n=1 Tax=Humulus lupulus TaxID=3486 RepID=UPI002B4051E5|nr:coatomer subunit delta-like [Humulus lupulus]
MSLDEEGVYRTAFKLIFAFDEVIPLGHKENVTVAQVKQYCEMESHEEKLHKLVMQSKINETKDVMKHKASEIDKSKIEKNRGDKGGFMSMGSGRIESSFSERSISNTGSGFGSGSGFGLNTEIDPYSIKSKGLFMLFNIEFDVSSTFGCQFLESLKAEGEVILEDVQPKAGQSRSSAPPLTDPVTLAVEEKLNVTLKRDGGVSNFDVQGTLSL